MLGWVILTLACIGYFLHEALRAPVIEDEEPNSAAAVSPDHSDPVEPEAQSSQHHEPARRDPDQ
ncbi:hypothetical protein ACRBEV_05780 [Methylobacterium phyllosphaerae]